MDKFISDYEKRRNENLENYQRDYHNEVAENIYNYVNNNKDNLPKDLQEQLKGFEIGSDNKLEINKQVGVKEFMGAEEVQTGLKGVDPSKLLGGSGEEKDNKQDNKQDNLQEQKEKSDKTKKKLEEFNEAKSEAKEDKK